MTDNEGNRRGPTSVVYGVPKAGGAKNGSGKTATDGSAAADTTRADAPVTEAPAARAGAAPARPAETKPASKNGTTPAPPAGDRAGNVTVERATPVANDPLAKAPAAPKPDATPAAGSSNGASAPTGLFGSGIRPDTARPDVTRTGTAPETARPDAVRPDAVRLDRTEAPRADVPRASSGVSVTSTDTRPDGTSSPRPLPTQHSPEAYPAPAPEAAPTRGYDPRGRSFDRTPYETPPAAAEPSSADPTRGNASRRAHLRVSRFNPKTVLRVSFVFSLCVFVVLLVAVAVLWLVLDAAGVFSSIESAAQTLTDKSGGGISGWLSFPRVMIITFLIGLVNVVLMTVLSTLTALLYNLCSELVGGIEVTLSER